MHIPTHILSGWCVGNLQPLTPRERLFCMVAASAAADLDGLGILISEELYWDLHHRLGHCFLYGVLLAGVLAGFSKHRVLSFVTYLCLFGVHLITDYFGSGSGWRLHLLWPFSDYGWRNLNPWPLSSWQNILTAGILLTWTFFIAMRYKRTPLECLMPSLDRKWTGRPPIPSSQPAQPG